MRHELVLSPKSQVTLPKELREQLGLKPGDTIVWTIGGDVVIMTPKSIDFNDLLGFMGAPPAGPATLEEIDSAIAEAAGRQAVSLADADEGRAA